MEWFQFRDRERHSGPQVVSPRLIARLESQLEDHDPGSLKQTSFIIHNWSWQADISLGFFETGLPVADRIIRARVFSMAYPEHLAKLREGTKAWNHWREEDVLQPEESTPPDLPEIGTISVKQELKAANVAAGGRIYGVSIDKLYGVDLSRAKLGGPEFPMAGVWVENFYVANLAGADLSGADLSGANLSLTDLTAANLSGADLRLVDFSRSNLTRADLSKARLGETIFGSTNLASVKGLDTCTHLGPSTLDHRTTAKSGPLPINFLRGCGLPDPLIDYLPSLLRHASRFYSCFISYSTKDQDFADQLYADLQNKGVRCWFAPHDIQGGQKIHEQIDKAIRLYDRLLLILSAYSIESEWVKTEIAKALQRERRDQRRMLFPLRLVSFESLRNWEFFDADIGKDSAREIREYYVPDFSNWKDHDSDQREFER